MTGAAYRLMSIELFLCNPGDEGCLDFVETALIDYQSQLTSPLLKVLLNPQLKRVWQFQGISYASPRWWYVVLDQIW